jgi:hypothetical protein
VKKLQWTGCKRQHRSLATQNVELSDGLICRFVCSRPPGVLLYDRIR